MTNPVLDPLARRRREPRTWTDPSRLDPDWHPPRQLGSVPTWVRIGVPIAVVAALIAVVAVLGGFGQRSDRITRLATEAVITSGPYTLTFSRATAVADQDFDDKLVWRVDAYGTVQTTDPTSDHPDTGDYAFVVANLPAAQNYVPVDQVVVGSRIGNDRSGGQVTPGLEPVPVVWSFEFPRSVPPTESIRVVIWEQEYTDTTITQTGELGWNLARDGYEVLLPLTVVPGPDAP